MPALDRPAAASRLFAVLGLALMLAAAPGCLLAAGAAAGAGGYAYVSGNAQGVIAAPRDDLAAAARHVLDRHDVVVTIDEVEDDGDRRIVGENPAGKNVRVIIDPVEGDEPACRLKVRVGLIGDREAAEALWHEIKRKAE